MLMKWLIIMLVFSIIKQINITSELNEMNITMIIVLFTGDGNLISKDRNGIKAVVVESPHQKPTIYTCEKDADQLCAQMISAFVSPSGIVQFLFLNPKFKASSLLL